MKTHVLTLRVEIHLNNFFPPSSFNALEIVAQEIKKQKKKKLIRYRSHARLNDDNVLVFSFSLILIFTCLFYIFSPMLSVASRAALLTRLPPFISSSLYFKNRRKATAQNTDI